jgi:hypothetical protein
VRPFSEKIIPSIRNAEKFLAIAAFNRPPVAMPFRHQHEQVHSIEIMTESSAFQLRPFRFSGMEQLPIS